MRIAQLRQLMTITATLGTACAVLASDNDAQDRRRTPVVDVFENSHNAVVNISTTRVVRMQNYGMRSPLDDIFDFGRQRYRQQRIQSIGSGIVVHESGYIVTNAHVVSQASDVQVTFADKSRLPADILAVDTEHDLAVIKVGSPKPLPHIKLGSSDDILIGETVVAIGNPLGLENTVTAGIVSALNRELNFGNDVAYTGLIQTDASINPGNSGGPLLNINSELIGINTAIRGDAQNIGFAIPVNRLWELLPSMLDIERHDRVRFGLSVSGTDAKVRAVRPDSPAAHADIQVGDQVVKFDNDAIRDGIDYYVHLLQRHPGDEVRLSLRRRGSTVNANVPLEAIPPPNGDKLAKDLLGVSLLEIPAEIRRRFDLPQNFGVLVSEVERGGPADRARVDPGDIILRLDRVTAGSLQHVGLALEQVKPGDPVLVEVLRIDADPPFMQSVAIPARKANKHP